MVKYRQLNRDERVQTEKAIKHSDKRLHDLQYEADKCSLTIGFGIQAEWEQSKKSMQEIVDTVKQDGNVMNSFKLSFAKLQLERGLDIERERNLLEFTKKLTMINQEISIIQNTLVHLRHQLKNGVEIKSSKKGGK